MINFITESFTNGYAYVRKHPELLMTLILVLVVPAAFLLSGQQFLTAAKENQERLEKDRIGMLHDVFTSFLRAADFEATSVQEQIEALSGQNPDITRMQVARELNGDVVVVASLDPSYVSTLAENPTAFRIGNAHPGESIIIPYAENGVRYWQSYKLVRTEGGEIYYIFVETSLAHIDALFADRILTAYYWLFGILAIVLLLIIRHVRLIDYAYLYTKTKEENEMKDVFTNMIAHELRAPLTAVRGYASLIQERQNLDSETKDQVGKIYESSERLLSIINDLLDVARMHSGRLSIKNAETDVKKVIASVIDTMRASAEEKKITLSEDGVLPEVRVLIDEKRLHQALTNLVSNAIKYTKSGAIQIALEERSNRIEIRVKDTGMGISAENQKNLFAPFFRVESEEVDKIVGTGLGMWITKQLIELMKGSIAVESIRGVGTHIVVTFPK
jgi:signal transduction histidine kinase